ncbi:MAG: hypothetical protein KAT71_02635, partial [Gammaproteobacteria bacterium]|nr:hypothetical protein [Gammaproteobacteria bacterium]
MIEAYLEKAIQEADRIQRYPDLLDQHPYVLVNAMMFCIKNMGEQLAQIANVTVDLSVANFRLVGLKRKVFYALRDLRNHFVHHCVFPSEICSNAALFVQFYRSLPALKKYLDQLKDESVRLVEPQGCDARELGELSKACHNLMAIFPQKDKAIYAARGDEKDYAVYYLNVAMQFLCIFNRIVNNNKLMLCDPNLLGDFVANHPATFDAMQNCLESFVVILGNGNRCGHEQPGDQGYNPAVEGPINSLKAWGAEMNKMILPFVDRGILGMISNRQIIKYLYERRKKAAHSTRDFDERTIIRFFVCLSDRYDGFAALVGERSCFYVHVMEVLKSLPTSLDQLALLRNMVLCRAESGGVGHGREALFVGFRELQHANIAMQGRIAVLGQQFSVNAR